MILPLINNVLSNLTLILASFENYEKTERTLENYEKIMKKQREKPFFANKSA